MCGINGIYAYHYAASPVDASEVARTRDHMAARGPDGTGEWYESSRRVGFGHRRLAIIDLSDAGAQPMVSLDGQHVITFNGEIYNYPELRRQLIAEGCTFRGHSDTEVLLNLYARRGLSMVRDLRGMFAFAIWDARADRLVLARDPLGIKPLYYADDGWTFRFASQVKALQAGGAIPDTPDPAGWTGFYLWGSVPEPYTTLAAVRSVPAGSTMVVDRIGAHRPERYFSVARTYCDAEQAPAEGASPEVLRTALLDSVRHHLIADVPVGIFLSAGLDSSSLLGFMRDAGYDTINAITIAFEEAAGTTSDEIGPAREVAAHYGAHHTTHYVSEAELLSDLPALLRAMDLPTIDGVNTWFVSKAAAATGAKVALSGLGGDELFGSYPSFRDIPAWVRWLHYPSRIPGLGRVSRELFSGLSRTFGRPHPKSAGLLELGGTYAGAYLLRRGLFMPWEIDQFLPKDMVAEGLRRLGLNGGAETVWDAEPQTEFARVATLETGLYMRNQLLRDADWASMAHGLELRVPFVDATLLAQAAALTVSGMVAGGKTILGTLPGAPLPERVLKRAKTGFTAPGLALRRQAGGSATMARGTPQTWARTWARSVADAFLPAGLTASTLRVHG